MAYQQQGDVLIKRIDKIPAGATSVERDKRGRVVLAEGEVTGHTHAIADAGCCLWEDGEKKYLGVDKPVTVVHEEHGPQVIEPGQYEIDIVKEYDHFAEEARSVRD